MNSGYVPTEFLVTSHSTVVHATARTSDFKKKKKMAFRFLGHNGLRRPPHAAGHISLLREEPEPLPTPDPNRDLRLKAASTSANFYLEEFKPSWTASTTGVGFQLLLDRRLTIDIKETIVIRWPWTLDRAPRSAALVLTGHPGLVNQHPNVQMSTNVFTRSQAPVKLWQTIHNAGRRRIVLRERTPVSRGFLIYPEPFRCFVRVGEDAARDRVLKNFPEPDVEDTADIARSTSSPTVQTLNQSDLAALQEGVQLTESDFERLSLAADYVADATIRENNAGSTNSPTTSPIPLSPTPAPLLPSVPADDLDLSHESAGSYYEFEVNVDPYERGLTDAELLDAGIKRSITTLTADPAPDAANQSEPTKGEPSKTSHSDEPVTFLTLHTPAGTAVPTPLTRRADRPLPTRRTPLTRGVTTSLLRWPDREMAAIHWVTLPDFYREQIQAKLSPDNVHRMPPVIRVNQALLAAKTFDEITSLAAMAIHHGDHASALVTHIDLAYE